MLQRLRYFFENMLLGKNNELDSKYLLIPADDDTNIDIDVKNETREKKTREKIIELIRQNEEITIKEIAKSIGITTKGVEWQLTRLKKAEILIRVGADKGGSWKIVQNKTCE